MKIYGKSVKGLWVKLICISFLSAFLLTGCDRFQSATSQIEKADIEIQKRDYAAAIIHLKNALQKEPENARARYMLGTVYLVRMEVPNAVKELKRALELKYDANLTLPTLAKALFLSGGTAELQNLDAQLATDPKARAEVLAQRGNGLLLTRNSKEAQILFQEALRLDPTSITAQFGNARIAVVNNNSDEADRIAADILKRAPREVDVIMFRSELQKFKGNHPGAIAHALKAVEIAPQDARVHMILGTEYIETNQFDLAQKQAHEIKERIPGSPFGPYLQALIEFRKKNMRVAQEEIQKSLKLAPNNPQALLLAATIELSLGIPAQAEQYLKTALSVIPNNVMAIRLMAQTHMRAGRAGNAIEILKPVVEKYPDNAELQGILGEAYFQNGDIQNANKHFAEAVRIDSTARPLTGLAMTHLATGNTDQAVIELEKAVKQQDSGIQADLMLIGARMQQREFDKAAEAIDALEKKVPQSPIPYGLRANLALMKNDVARAYGFLERALQIDPNYYFAVHRMAQLDVAAGKVNEAQKRLEEFLRRNDKHPEALLGLAEVRTVANADPAEVIEIIKRAQAADPKKTQATEVLVRFLLAVDKPKEALEVAKQGTLAHPESVNLIDLLAITQMAAGQPAEAAASLTRLTSLQPRNAYAWGKLAQAQSAAGDKSTALLSINKAIALKPEDMSLLEIAINMRLANKNYKEAMEIASGVQKNLPKSPIGKVLEGDVYLAQTKFQEAAESYDQALKIQPATVIFLRKHRTLLMAQRTAEADKALVVWLKQNPKDVQTLLYAADNAGKNKKYNEAISYYREILALQPKNMAALNNLAWMYYETGNLTEAERYILTALKLQPNQAALLDTHGMILAKQGKLDQALIQMKRAIDLMPDRPVLHLNYARTLLKAGKKTEAKQELDVLRRLGVANTNEVQALAQELG